MYSWQKKTKQKAFLALANGEIFHGYTCGAPIDQVGEVVFNTGMSGYQEIISDPSYTGQIVTFTVPELGNYGCNASAMESDKPRLSGIVLHEMNPPSNFTSEISLEDFLKTNNIPALAGVDTRRLTLSLRAHGNQKAYLHCSETPITEAEAIAKAQAWEGLDGQDYATKVTIDKPFEWNTEGEYHLVAIDFGIKYNILRLLADAGFRVTVVPAKTTAEEILKYNSDGVFLSNGPADPSAVTYAIDTIKALLGKKPMMGICLGHQLLSIACGAECVRLKFGHHGCNHPVKNLKTGDIEITSQNHNFAITQNNLPECLEVTHINLNDQTVEGVRHRTQKAFSVQYHPESAPGPHDSRYLFDEFVQLIQQ